MKDSVLLINDLPGYGKVALAAMLPVMSHAGIDTYTLPTALVSNTLDYGLFEILETTQYMHGALAVWEKLGLRFNAICAGFIVSQDQARLVTEYCREQSAAGTQIFVDPIMGDDGKLYNGIGQGTVEYMKDLCSTADIIVPNLTEAVFLTGMFQNRAALSRREGRELVDGLRALGAKSVVITSAKLLPEAAESEKSAENAVLLYDHKTNEYSEIPFEYVDVRLPGTGDIFSALLFSRVLGKASLRDAAQKTMRDMEKLILANRENGDKYKGIPIERYLHLLDFSHKTS